MPKIRNNENKRLNDTFKDLMKSLKVEIVFLKIPNIYKYKIYSIDSYTKIIPVSESLDKLLMKYQYIIKPELNDILKHIIWRLQIMNDILQQLKIECQRRMLIVLKMLYYDNEKSLSFYSSKYSEHIDQKSLLYALEDTLCEYNDNPSKYSPKKLVSMICRFAHCNVLPSIMVTTIYNFFDIAPFVEDEIRKKETHKYQPVYGLSVIKTKF